MSRALFRYGEAAGEGEEEGEEDEGGGMVVSVVLLLLLLVVVVVVGVGTGRTVDDGMFVDRGRGECDAGATREQEEPAEAATTGSPVSCARGECVRFV